MVINKTRILLFLGILLLVGSCAASRATKQLSLIEPQLRQADDAIVVLSTSFDKEASEHGGAEILLFWYPFNPTSGELVDRRSRNDLSKEDKKKWSFTAYHNATIMGSSEDRTGTPRYHVFTVLPGTYILHSANFNDQYYTSYNLGSVYFSIEPGEVLYLGNHSLTTEMEGNLLFGSPKVLVEHGQDQEQALNYVAANYPELEDRLSYIDPQEMPYNVSRATGVMSFVSTDATQACLDCDIKGPYIFNKPGTSFETYQSDSLECAELARGTNRSGPMLYGNPIVLGIFGGIESGQLKRTNADNCMFARGYRKVSVDREQSRELKSLPDAERDARLGILVGSEDPVSELMSDRN